MPVPLEVDFADVEEGMQSESVGDTPAWSPLALTFALCRVIRLSVEVAEIA